MMLTVIEYGVWGIAFLLLATWRALPLLAIAAVVDLAFRRRLAARFHAALWTLVLLRLALPFSLPAEWSLQRPYDEFAFYMLGFPSESSEPRVIYETRDSRIRAIERANAPRPVPPPAAVDRLPVQAPIWGPFEYFVAGLWLTLVVVWPLVAAASIVRALVAHWRFARRLAKTPDLDDPRLSEMVRRECESLQISQRPKAKMVDGLSTPGVFGLFRSVICLPPGALASLSDQELRWALRHELAHVRRRDAWTLSFAAMILSLQWLNPFAWLAVSRLRSHVEAAADDLALLHASRDEAREYGRLLLAFAQRASSKRSSPSLGLVPFVSGRSLRGRIERLTRERKRTRRWFGWILAAGTVALGAIGLTDAAERVVETRRILVPDLGKTLPAPSAADSPAALRTYEIAATLERISETHPDVDACDLLLDVCGNLAPNRAPRIEEGKLIAEVDADQDRRLAELLEAWNEGGPRQIAVEIRLMQAEVAIASSVDWTTSRLRGLERQGTHPLLAARISEPQLVDLLRNMQGDTRSNVLQAPRVTVFNGQSFALGDVVQTPFVTDVDANPDGTFTPVIDVYDEGLKVTLRPKTSGDGTIDLRFEVRVSKIGDVAEPMLPYRAPTWVQAPEVSVSSLASEVRLATGESVLIALPPVFDEEVNAEFPSILYCAITPRLVDEK